MGRRPLRPATLAASLVTLVRRTQRLVAASAFPNCYYWYVVIAILACAGIGNWGAALTIAADELLPPGK